MSGAPEQSHEAMVRAFELAYAAKVPFREDAAIAHELAAEVAPVIEALALVGEGAAAATHEAYALLTLLSHRAGLLGATPSATFCVLDAILEALAAGGLTIAPAFRDQLWLVVVEGYSSGRDERVTRELRQAFARAQVCFRLAPGCLVGFLAGCLEPEVVEEKLAELARRLLREDARSCLLDVARLETASAEPTARAIAGFLMTAASVGVRLWLVVREGELKEAIVAAGATGHDVSLLDEFEPALPAVMGAAGVEMRARGRGWAKALFEKPR